MKRNLQFLTLFLFISTSLLSQVVVDFETEATSLNFQFFGGSLEGAQSAIIPNPNSTGINTSSNVLEFKKGADSPAWGGGFANPAPSLQVDATNGGQVCLKVHFDHIGNVALKLEQPSDGGENWITQVPNTKINEWEEICFDLSANSIEDSNLPAAGRAFGQIVLFADFGIETGADINYYLDDITYTGIEATPKVTFSVDMNGYGSAFTSVYVSGTLNEWSGDANPLNDDDQDGIWSGTIPLTAGTYEYKFTIDSWAEQEIFAGGEDCTVTTGGFTNRAIEVTEDASVCFNWNSCDACGSNTGGGDPTDLAGTTWKLAPIAQALAVGPTKGDFTWWSSSADDVSTRACLFDDTFVFGADGTFSNVQDGETWLEVWQGVDADGCGAPVAPHDGSNAATWSYDETAGTITLTGMGAHLGLPKVNNGGELTNPADAPASITYPVVFDGNTMTVDIDYGGGFWHFVFQKETDTEPEPDPTDLAGTTWKLAPIAQALAVGPTKGDFTWWSSSADDVSTRACLFDDTFVFGADGTFSNIQDGETWLEVWQGADADGCGAPVAPHDGSNAATWSYDETAGTITLTGMGAHLGLPKVNNGGELTNPADAPASITYPVVFDGNTMTVDIDYGGGFWHFVFQRESTTSINTEIVREDLFTFFPNPASSQIQIQSDENIDELLIRDITGKILVIKRKPASNETVDVSGLTGGFYIIECRVGNKISVEKLSISN